MNRSHGILKSVACDKNKNVELGIPRYNQGIIDLNNGMISRSIFNPTISLT